MNLPDEMTPAMHQALSLMLWHTGPTAHAFRLAGHNIKTRAEDEQAFVLFWALKLAIEHGDNWRKVALAQIEAMAKAAAMGDNARRTGI
jgi:hypothetical protein